MRVGVIGGSGYVGGELLRLLYLHPKAEITAVASRKHAGEFVFSVHPNFRGSHSSNSLLIAYSKSKKL